MTIYLEDAELDHLTFESPDPEMLARFHADAMDMEVSTTGEDCWQCIGPARRLMFISGEARKLSYASFRLRDEAGLRLLLKRALANGVAVKENLSPWLTGEAFSVVDPDGNNICFGLAQAEENHGNGLSGRLQHLTFATFRPDELFAFYRDKLCFRVTDRVFDNEGNLTGFFVSSSFEHHTIAGFKANRQGVDHHAHEADDWNTIRDWCDRFAAGKIDVVWGPGRHGPGNNLFAFIEDPDGNMIEVSTEIENVHDRPAKDWKQEARTLNLWGWAINRTP